MMTGTIMMKMKVIGLPMTNNPGDQVLMCQNRTPLWSRIQTMQEPMKSTTAVSVTWSSDSVKTCKIFLKTLHINERGRI